ncbi:uncharacterized protein EV420DRAFT_1750477 [Desarmillaria tabescens]|uniref:Uncharacterized protein n=1 Tax=Armillaria tabescens TaxID=1929756 RepID=A0AA39MY66_ARMTA|nr:uncharacterized protein EV420DRAFT_1750477 [Desarmillaria tabescens]KAK0450409.1 hypothetical protein EV420DRAFT_1750477 [Desarmillaria tabescens]
MSSVAPLLKLHYHASAMANRSVIVAGGGAGGVIVVDEERSNLRGIRRKHDLRMRKYCGATIYFTADTVYSSGHPETSGILNFNIYGNVGMACHEEITNAWSPSQLVATLLSYIIATLIGAKYGPIQCSQFKISLDAYKLTVVHACIIEPVFSITRSYEDKWNPQQLSWIWPLRRSTWLRGPGLAKEWTTTLPHIRWILGSGGDKAQRGRNDEIGECIQRL